MYTIRLDAPGGLDSSLVGGKAHGLAFLAKVGVPVSPGFTVSTEAYRRYTEEAGLRGRIAGALKDLDRTSVAALAAAEASISAWFEQEDLPSHIRSEVHQSYDLLCNEIGVTDLSVAVRSSATAEDSQGASFAGEYDTFVGISGADEVERHVRRCWASAFTARGMTYAWKNGVSPADVEMAVVVQKTIRARAAGVMFTLSPLTGDRSRIVIEASYGLGLSVVGGEVTPDRYVVAKIGGEILERVVGEKQIEYLTGGASTPVNAERRAVLCLHDDEVRALARFGKALEREYGRPVDVEFAIDRELAEGRGIVFLQCRPETYWWSRHTKAKPSPIGDAAQAVLASVLKK